ncbi:MAG: D-alanyl-D-alanine carboxypeptidase family protein [Burkholderiaceae bacterium]
MNSILAFVLALASLSFASPALAQAPQPPGVAAKNYFIVDLTSDTVLAQRDADAPADPASLTKLMTAYLVFSAIRDKKLELGQSLPVSQRAWAERRGGGSLMFIDTTMTPKVDELLRGMIVQSGNDASVALAEGVAGSLDQFVAMMNAQATAWGLKNTHFKNVTGLSETGHSSTARELAIIATRIIRDFPDFYTYYSLPSYKYNNIAQPNRNLLLRRDPSVDGMKTGYTAASGYCLIASAVRIFPNLGAGGTAPGKRRLLSVLLNATSMQARANESQNLLNWGFQAFDTVRLFDDARALATPEVWKGKTRVAKLGAAGAVFVTIAKGDARKLKTQIERTEPLLAPLAQGQRVGTIKVTSPNGEGVVDVPLVVLEAVEQAPLLGRIWDTIRLWIR